MGGLLLFGECWLIEECGGFFGFWFGYVGFGDVEVVYVFDGGYG